MKYKTFSALKASIQNFSKHFLKNLLYCTGAVCCGHSFWLYFSSQLVHLNHTHLALVRGTIPINCDSIAGLSVVCGFVGDEMEGNLELHTAEPLQGNSLHLRVHHLSHLPSSTFIFIIYLNTFAHLCTLWSSMLINISSHWNSLTSDLNASDVWPKCKNIKCFFVLFFKKITVYNVSWENKWSSCTLFFVDPAEVALYYY